MPTPIKSSKNMSIGGRDGGKHLTRAELESRQAAESGHTRRRVLLKPPDWLKESEDAMKVWKSILKKLKGIELLDDLDSELLAIYCDALVNYRLCSRGMKLVGEDGEMLANDERMKTTQAWARIVTSYADKLGLTPGGRARLAKRKAEQVFDPFATEFGG
jgi:P27 family predicted phage terminase small subunit